MPRTIVACRSLILGPEPETKRIKTGMKLQMGKYTGHLYGSFCWARKLNLKSTKKSVIGELLNRSLFRHDDEVL